MVREVFKTATSFGIIIVVVSLLQSLLSSSDAFSMMTVKTRCHQIHTHHNSRTQLLDSSSSGGGGGDSSRDEEIAKLEEQLKLLKEQQQSQDVSEEVSTGSAIEEEEEVPIEMFLSEGWREAEASKNGEESGGSLTAIIGAVVLAISLVAFSQIPVGQEDLSKYSVIKAPTEQIDLGDINRARNSADI
mmetsp:Transcript_23836/g.56272  ORF Transcript_23836/g.56272 Transcript_23836/m.56272 type:complete len:188 (+) Transcript_23836:109-672(+)